MHKTNYKKGALVKKREYRDTGFWDFINKRIKYTEETYSQDSGFSALNSEFDYFVTGSDQVWNPYYEGSNEFFYLPFASREKRITYAPSIGVNHIPDEMKEKKCHHGFKTLTK